MAPRSLHLGFIGLGLMGTPMAGREVAGGETTVTVHGRGGRNVACLLSLGVALDGQEEIAGVLGPDSLANNDGHGFFGALGDAVITGPTLTNVNDFRAILIEAGASDPIGLADRPG